jgi:hypothetical protein
MLFNVFCWKNPIEGASSDANLGAIFSGCFNSLAFPSVFFYNQTINQSQVILEEKSWQSIRQPV